MPRRYRPSFRPGPRPRSTPWRSSRQTWLRRSMPAGDRAPSLPKSPRRTGTVPWRGPTGCGRPTRHRVRLFGDRVWRAGTKSARSPSPWAHRRQRVPAPPKARQGSSRAIRWSVRWIRLPRPPADRAVTRFREWSSAPFPVLEPFGIALVIRAQSNRGRPHPTDRSKAGYLSPRVTPLAAMNIDKASHRPWFCQSGTRIHQAKM